LSLAVAHHLKPSVSVESSLIVCCNSMSLDIVCPLFLNLSERALDFRSVEQRFLLCILLFFRLPNPGDEDTDSCMIFFRQPFLIFVESCDDDTTRTSTPAAPQAPPVTPPPRAPTVDHPVGPITRACARELNFIVLLRNEGLVE
jgi:hypothetical protein